MYINPPYQTTALASQTNLCIYVAVFLTKSNKQNKINDRLLHFATRLICVIGVLGAFNQEKGDFRDELSYRRSVIELTYLVCSPRNPRGVRRSNSFETDELWDETDCRRCNFSNLQCNQVRKTHGQKWPKCACCVHCIFRSLDFLIHA